MNGRSTQILLVEHHEADVRLATEALKAGKVVNRHYVVHDGVEALEYLGRQGEYATAPRPGLNALERKCETLKMILGKWQYATVSQAETGNE